MNEGMDWGWGVGGSVTELLLFLVCLGIPFTAGFKEAHPLLIKD